MSGGGGCGHLDNTEAGAGVAGLITDTRTEDPDISPGSPADQKLQGFSLLVSEAPLVVLLAEGERGERGERRQGQDERSGLHQEDGGHCLPVCHPRQPASQSLDPPPRPSEFHHWGAQLCHTDRTILVNPEL